MARILLILLCYSMLAGCYYMQAAAGQWEVIHKRVPLEDVIGAADTSPELASRLRLLNAARDFSIEVLGLPDNKSYRTYTDLSRDYVVWNVFAAPEFSLQPEQWCFPIAGCVNYRGYFSHDKAIRESERLAKKGFDVAVGGVAAYSTLGNFSDPLLSTMMRWGDIELIAMLFHELAHQVVYVKDDSAFNESFATAVEEFGVKSWLEFRGQGEQMAAYHENRELQRRLMVLVAAARGTLRSVYSADIEDSRKRELKRARLKLLARDIRAERERHGRESAGWFSDEINNAHLISMTLYEGRLPSFRTMLSQCDDNILCFYRAAQELADLGVKERQIRLDALSY
ncbi:MAG: aminopeptidase [Proteobacteria bacterium]|nr:aminopeptidase [Pseudomonadota bacterium]